MITVYWTVKFKDAGLYVIGFWTKPDKSNMIEFKAVTMEAEKLRNKITSITGNANFTMDYVKATDFRQPPPVISSKRFPAK